MLEGISRKLTDILRNVAGKGSINEKNIQDAVDEIKVALLEADVNLRVVRRFVNQTIEEAKGEKVLHSVDPGQQFVKIIYDRMVEFLGDSRQELQLKGPDTLSVVLLLGLQGSGKTTTAAKLAGQLKKEGRRPLLIAADLVRPAAVEQLKLLGEQVGVEVFSQERSDPIRVVREGIKHAERGLFNTVIVDTSGRMHLDGPLMEELKSLRDASRPDETVLVADAMSGQQAAEVAKEFNEQIGLSGVILTKFDSDARGGAALSVKTITGKPIKFIGTGEKLADLEPFYPERMASRILGMGDVVTLVEKAQATIDAHEAEELQRRVESETFTLEDYLAQFARLKKMGSVRAVLDMIPGMQGKIDDDQIDEKELKREEAMILSMTRTERKNYRIIGPSRRKRIARGSGTSVHDINHFLKKFEKVRLMMKKAVKNKKYQANILSQLGA